MATLWSGCEPVRDRGMSLLEPLRLESLGQIFGMLGRTHCGHPLAAVIAASWQEPIQITTRPQAGPIVSELYAISLKRGDECHIEFGRQVYDGQAGTIVFLAPGQAVKTLDPGPGVFERGEFWTLVIHPDLLIGRPIASSMVAYRFFGYEAREALHLTEAEGRLFSGVVRQLERDIESVSERDDFVEDILCAHLQLLFSYCRRAYARQFQLRALETTGIAERFDRHLAEYWALSTSPSKGIPTVQSCARVLGYSPDYLSELLRAATGMSARERIQRVLVETAKERLLAPNCTSSEVAYALGFEHPQHFARLFRKKTGQSPGEWRSSQLPSVNQKALRRG